MIEDYSRLLTKHDLTVVQTAQGLDVFSGTGGDSRIGVIDFTGGVYRPSSFAVAMFNDMAEERTTATSTNANLHMMASKDKTKASLLVWNMSDTAQAANITLPALPYASTRLKIYKIENDNAGANPLTLTR